MASPPTLLICARSPAWPPKWMQPRLPIHPIATLAQALHGGEDYELLFTAKPAVRMPRAIAGVPITQIGRIVRTRRAQAPVTLITPHGPQPLEPRGWEHFS